MMYALIVSTLLVAAQPGPDGSIPFKGPIGGPVGGLVSPTASHDQCIPPDLRAQISAQLETHRLVHSHTHSDAPPLYRFFPQGGVLYGDLAPTYHVDLDQSSLFQDYECGPIAYDAHGGQDMVIRSWAEQDIGVPVFAVASGTVLFANDGEPDKNTFCNGSGNYVIIDHGGGREGWYFHMQNGSITVLPGHQVVEGQQLGNTASSGCSFYPHLHFESQQNGIIYEPLAGACRPGASGYVIQQAYQTNAQVLDFGVTSTDMSTVAWLPEPLPREGQIPLSTQNVFFWVQFHFLPTQSDWRVRWIDPNGVSQRDSGTVPFGNPEPFLTPWYYWWDNAINQAQLAGDWRIVFDVNGQTLIDAPVRAVTTINPNFNRPPEPITVSFDPPTPEDDHALFAHVQTSNWKDDLDWDVVRYRYVWKVNGLIVRDVTTAGRADAIKAGTFAGTDAIEVCVTPSDGTANGATVCVSSNSCYADCDSNSTLNIFDYICFGSAFAIQSPYADCDGNGAFNIFDYICFGGAYATGCP